MPPRRLHFAFRCRIAGLEPVNTPSNSRVTIAHLHRQPYVCGWKIRKLGQACMIRFLFRLLAMVALSVAAIMTVLDATRSIAASALVTTPLGESWAETLPDLLMLAEQNVRHYIHPLAWDPVALFVLGLPGFAVFGALALLFYAIGRKPERRAGRFAIHA
jgi:hypothetical protein